MILSGKVRLQLILRLRLHEIGFVWNWQEIATEKPCVQMGPGRFALDLLSYPEPDGFTCESDPVCRVNSTQFRQSHARMDPIQIKPNHTDLVLTQPKYH